MDRGIIFEKLIHMARGKNLSVKFVPFKRNYGRLRGDRIGVANDLGIDEINYNLAYELAHFYLHYDKGDTIHSEKYAEYEEQADRAAVMLLEALACGMGKVNEKKGGAE